MLATSSTIINLGSDVPIERIKVAARRLENPAWIRLRNDQPLCSANRDTYTAVKVFGETPGIREERRRVFMAALSSGNHVRL